MDGHENVSQVVFPDGRSAELWIVRGGRIPVEVFDSEAAAQAQDDDNQNGAIRHKPY